MEGTWGGLDWDEDWFVAEGEPGPEVLTGPLDDPKSTQRAAAKESLQ